MNSSQAAQARNQRCYKRTAAQAQLSRDKKQLLQRVKRAHLHQTDELESEIVRLEVWTELGCALCALRTCKSAGLAVRWFLC